MSCTGRPKKIRNLNRFTTPLLYQLRVAITTNGRSMFVPADRAIAPLLIATAMVKI